MKSFKYILNIIFSFLLVILLGLNLFSGILSFIVFNPNYYIDKFEENKFYDNVLQEVNSGFENFIYQSGLPENTIVNLATDDMIKADINSIVLHITENKELVLSSDKIRDELDVRISDFLDKENRTLTKNERENITKFEDLIVSSYEESILPIRDFIDELKSIYDKVFNLYNKIKLIPIIGLIIILFAMFVINKKSKFDIVNFSGISLLSLGVLLKLLENVVLKNIDIDNVIVFTSSLTSAFQYIFKDIIFGLNLLGNWIIVVGICFILFYSIIHGSETSKNNVNK